MRGCRFVEDVGVPSAVAAERCCNSASFQFVKNGRSPKQEGYPDFQVMAAGPGPDSTPIAICGGEGKVSACKGCGQDECSVNAC